MNTIADNLQNAYLDYINNFLTVQGYAHFYELSINEASAIVEAGRAIHEDRVLVRN